MFSRILCLSIRITVAFQIAGSRSTYRSGAQAWTASESRSRLSGTANNISMFVSEGACGVTTPELNLKLEHNRNSSIICPLAAHLTHRAQAAQDRLHSLPPAFDPFQAHGDFCRHVYREQNHVTDALAAKPQDCLEIFEQLEDSNLLVGMWDGSHVPGTHNGACAWVVWNHRELPSDGQQIALPPTSWTREAPVGCHAIRLSKQN